MRLFVGLLTAFILANPARAQVPPRDPGAQLNFPLQPGSFGYTFENAFPNLSFTSPIAITSPPGETNRLFVVEQAGRIRVIPNLANPTLETFLDLRTNTVTGGEQGMLGLAFHPGYATNGRFFVFRSVTSTTRGATNRLHQRISEFRVSPTNANRTDNFEKILLQQADDAGNHNGGELAFGPDGYLYASLGDEGGANDNYLNSQKLDRDFFSAILRLDVDNRPGSRRPNPHPANEAYPGAYSVPADNPFLGLTRFLGRTLDPARVRTEFHSIGWRNPWRMSFDRDTGELWVGDVGQDTRESVMVTRLGANHGWGFLEGDGPGPMTAPAGFTTNPTNQYVRPIYVYRHGSGPMQGDSITGGLVYRGTRMSQLVGAYVFSDYVRGNVWALRRVPGAAPQVERITSLANISAFGTDPRNGDLLAAHHSGSRLVRLRYNATFVGSPLPPTLTDTGAFRDVANLVPLPAFVPYQVNLPFWSDNARKTRWFLPAGNSRIGFSPDQPWITAPGSVWMKHFDMEMIPGDPASSRRLETRFLVRNSGGVYGVTYRWSSPDNAVLVADAGGDELLRIGTGAAARTQLWRYPSRAECLACHTAAAGGSLSFNTPQLNRRGADGVHQIAALATAGYFSNAPVSEITLPSHRPTGTDAEPDLQTSLESRARAYLSVNCAPCHQPGGPGPARWDARTTTPLDLAGILNAPLNDNRGDESNRVIVPGDPARSILLQRLRVRGIGQMPPIASDLADTNGMALIESWILSLSNRVDFATWAREKLGDTSGNPPRTWDSDLDGASDHLEYLTGTNPSLAGDAWRPVMEIERGVVQLRLKQPANVAFRVEMSASWASAEWLPLEHPFNLPVFPETARDVEIPLEPTGIARYYRVQLWQP
jgi:glucose/arabinose dehydrogenase/mono/diheme cytochrome c family protein